MWKSIKPISTFPPHRLLLLSSSSFRKERTPKATPPSRSFRLIFRLEKTKGPGTGRRRTLRQRLRERVRATRSAVDEPEEEPDKEQQGNGEDCPEGAEEEGEEGPVAPGVAARLAQVAIEEGEIAAVGLPDDVE